MLLVSLILRRTFPFAFLLDWTRMFASIQLNAVLVQYAEYGTTTAILLVKLTFIF